MFSSLYTYVFCKKLCDMTFEKHFFPIPQLVPGSSEEWYLRYFKDKGDCESFEIRETSQKVLIQKET